MTHRILLVDPSATWLAHARRSISDDISVTTFTEFSKARAHALKAKPDLVATNLRLGAYNGLHLVHLVASTEAGTRCVVFSDRPDPVLMAEARRAGAFVETAATVPHTLAAYVRSPLPPEDRRISNRTDRRAIRRGGRRSIDALALGIAPDEHSQSMPTA